MVSINYFRKIALGLPAVTEAPHFEKKAFKVVKKIFATYDEVNQRACFNFSIINQDIFSLIDKQIIYPVPNKWGKKGWTFVEMKHVSKKLFSEMIIASYCEAAPGKYSNAIIVE